MKLPASRLLSQIHTRQRLPIWALRLIFGAMLLCFSEFIMWQNPASHTPAQWIARGIAYLALASILLDIVARFQARELAGLGLVCGLYGLVCATIVTVPNNTLESLPLTLLVRGLGLQTGAGLYALLFFVLVMRGRDIEPRALAGAAAIGALWGIWVKWYPAQPTVGWGVVPIETATLYIVGAFVVIGVLLIVIGPRFRVVREADMQLEWWEWILVGIPLFVGLLGGMLDANVIPVLPLALVVAIGGVFVRTLFLQKHGHEPSILAEMTITAPNAQTYVFLSVVFLFAGTLSAALIGNDPNTIVGAGVYIVIAAIGGLWPPAAVALVGVRAYRRED